MIYFSDFGDGAAGWSPSDLSPYAWYDPSDLSTLWQDTAGTTPVTAAGQSVARMDDKSGNGRHMVQPTLSFRPVLAEATVKSLQFNGSTDYMEVSFGETRAQPNYFCMGFGLNSSSGNNQPFFNGINLSNRNQFGKPGASSVQWYMNAGTQRTFGDKNLLNHIATLVFDAGSSSARIDAAAQTLGGSVGTENLTGLRLGANASLTAFAAMRFYGLILCDTSFLADLTDMESWMADKSNVTLP